MKLALYARRSQPYNRPDAPRRLPTHLALSATAEAAPTDLPDPGGAARLTDLLPSVSRDHTDLGDSAVHDASIPTGLIDCWRPAECAGNAGSVPPGLHVQLDLPARRITARGELDLATTGMLAGAVATLMELNPGDTTVDFCGLSFIDARGLGCLVGSNNQLAALDATLKITGVTPRLRRIFDITGLDGFLHAK